MRRLFRKAQPTASDVHVNRPLTNLSVAFMQSETDYVADRIFPVVPVEKKADSYYVYARDDWFRLEAKERAPATESAGGGWELNTETYNAKKHAFHKDVDDDLRTNADAALNVDNDATRFVTQQMLMIREQRWIDAYFKAGVWGTEREGVTGAPGAPTSSAGTRRAPRRSRT